MNQVLDGFLPAHAQVPCVQALVQKQRIDVQADELLTSFKINGSTTPFAAPAHHRTMLLINKCEGEQCT
jgi:hypothetical protein